MKKLKVCLIAEEFDENSGQGVSSVSNKLYNNLKRLGVGVEGIAIGTSLNPYKRVFLNVIKNPYKILGKEADIYHFIMPEISFPVLLKKPSVITIHDIIPLVLKNERKKMFNAYFRFMMTIAKKAEHLIAISESTKKDLIHILGIPEDKITVVYNGVDHKRFYPLKKKPNKKIVIGFLGGLVKRKNAKMVLKVAKILENENIIFKIGGKGKGFDELVKIKKDLKLKNVEFAGFVPSEDLNKFYNSLDLFLLPTTYDGFSLPGLEAMATGCPIIASKGGAIPEVAGDAGILIDPNDEEDIVKAIRRFISDKTLRKKMAKASLDHSKKFSWEKQAKEVLKVYRKVLG